MEYTSHLENHSANTNWCWLQEVEDLERQLRLMSDSHSALAAASGMRQLTIADRGRSSNRVSAHSLAKKVGSTHETVASVGTVYATLVALVALKAVVF